MHNEALFYSNAKAWLERMLSLNPVLATELGDHRWDDRLADYSPQALDQLQQELAACRPHLNLPLTFKRPARPPLKPWPRSGI